MPTFPAALNPYLHNGYSYVVEPAVVNFNYVSNNTRQRYLFQKRDDMFNVKIYATDADLLTFEAFVTDDISNGADTYTGPYFTSDVEYTGTLEMIDGTYKVAYLKPDAWEISFKFELKNRDLTEEEKIYDLVNAVPGFDALYDLLKATEIAVNTNNL